ncbi:alanine racemase [Desulfovibrio porci]|uniref:alanine racemase n=1 Tax=Desulfovibrio porci TaxID=2605782 RepID=UPI002A82E50F|nr:alanine racemase [Desulfovibrio porci]MDY3809017.1 alanine racemase [Desulfovibrio porci]
MHIDHLPTPALLLDEARLRRNITRLDERLRALGVNLRPHCKTCKSMDAARLCMASPQGPITVSSLAEAEYFAEHGVTDICYAVGVAPAKLARAMILRERGVRLFLLLDSMENARLLAAFAGKHGHVFDLLLEIDCDGHRSGLRPDDPELLECAAVLTGAGQNLLGVLTHAGSAYDLAAPSPEAFAALAKQERDAAVSAAQRLRAAGHGCPVVSVGSTPTAFFGRDFTGVSEVRAGVYMFQDLVMAGLGVCRVEDIALSVLCTVIGRRKSDGNLVVDAGWTALSRDAGLPGRFAREGYGLVCDVDGKLLPGLRVAETNQEHGIIAAREGMCPPLPVGAQLRILPTHACAAAAAFDAYHVCREREVTALWPRCRGW